jgi:hypothetical protein
LLDATPKEARLAGPLSEIVLRPLPLLWVALAALTARATEQSSASVSAANNLFMPFSPA